MSIFNKEKMKEFLNINSDHYFLHIENNNLIYFFKCKKCECLVGYNIYDIISVHEPRFKQFHKTEIKDELINCNDYIVNSIII